MTDHELRDLANAVRLQSKHLDDTTLSFNHGDIDGSAFTSEVEAVAMSLLGIADMVQAHDIYPDPPTPTRKVVQIMACPTMPGHIADLYALMSDGTMWVQTPHGPRGWQQVAPINR